jgi:hypothetical protein
MIQKNQNNQASGKCLTLGGLVYQLNVPAAVQVSGGGNPTHTSRKV